ncbi:MAG TPA: RNA-binding S4 domain-containing protein [Firmicutes bacterium]|nr:RNA-binding S4 domain-containing protein [Bacillota bacterium]
MEKEIRLKGNFITLGSLVKLALHCSGGEAKHIVQSGQVYVNGERELRRGRKLLPGDRVTVDGYEGEFVVRGATGTE